MSTADPMNNSGLSRPKRRKEEKQEITNIAQAVNGRSTSQLDRGVGLKD